MVFKSQLLQNALERTNISEAENGLSVKSDTPELEPVIIIDPNSRAITIPQELKTIGVAGDHKCETVYFMIPRYFDGEDLSTHSCLIRFINAGNEYGESTPVSMTTDDDEIKIGWLIDNNATRYKGTLQFTVQFETQSNGVQYQWQTTPAEFHIMEGLNIEKTITDKDDILFRSLVNRINDLQEQVDTMRDTMGSALTFEDRITQLEQKVRFLENNVVYTLNDD